jgi:hypothetical protein
MCEDKKEYLLCEDERKKEYLLCEDERKKEYLLGEDKENKTSLIWIHGEPVSDRDASTYKMIQNENVSLVYIGD